MGRVEIAGETIAEFDASQLRLDRRSTPALRVTIVNSIEMVLGVQTAWNAVASGVFHWPAVYKRNPTATTFVVHDGPDVLSACALFQCVFCTSVPCDRDHRNDMTYVSFIEVAPAHRRSRHEFRGLGAFVVAVASTLACQSPSQGALGLHSLDSVAPFYRKLGFSDVDCLNEYKELYLEIGKSQALKLRDRIGDMR